MLSTQLGILKDINANGVTTLILEVQGHSGCDLWFMYF